ncbi:unnamed protein product [Allacma fusca]|uniref:Uncharacterized protein n=1 Tax=Allacma fusca TaxID=39272 RepID=A0A8J2PZ19_9HEXA|nr:unnamed protein product [Allacma fusca]
MNFLSLLSLFCLLWASANAQSTFQNPIFDGNSADPSVMRLGNFYYLTLSTNSETEITIFKSPTLTSFREAEKSIAFKAPTGFRDIWASEMHEVNGDLYIYFCMASNDGSGIHMYVIKADDPLEPMGSWSSHFKALPTFPHGSTDGTVFKHGGQLYLVWGSTASLWIGRMINATTVGNETLLLRGPTLDWECSLDAVSGEYPCIVEGPYFIYSNNVSYLVFSAGSTFGPDYVMGMMSIDDGKDPMVASNWWFGDDKPVFWRNDEENVFTTGHATFTWSPDGSEMWMVYHASDTTGNPNGKRIAHIDRMSFDDTGKPIFPRPSGYNHTLNSPSGQVTRP